MSGRQLPIIVALGTTQTLAWASSYYLPAILADPIARDLGVSSNWIFAAFSASLVISALLGPRVGRQIDLVGGRSVLSISNLTLAAGLALLGFAYSIPVLVVAWLLLGVGMAFGLYDAAFAALGRIYGDAARGSITGITLIAGFASTVGWPLIRAAARWTASSCATQRSVASWASATWACVDASSTAWRSSTSRSRTNRATAIRRPSATRPMATSSTISSGASLLASVVNSSATTTVPYVKATTTIDRPAGSRKAASASGTMANGTAMSAIANTRLATM